MREQQHTKASYQAKIESENIKKQQINSLLHLTKAELSKGLWNPSAPINQ